MFFSKNKLLVIAAVIGLIVAGGFSRLFDVEKRVSDWYFYAGMVCVCAGIIVILGRAALFAGWNFRRVGESEEHFKARIKTPEEITAAKNRPLKLSKAARWLLASGATMIVVAIVITL